MNVYIKLMLFFYIFLLAACVSNDSSIVVEGMILGENEEPVSFANINISGLDIKSKKSGYFCFEGLHPESSILIRVQAEGYQLLDAELEYGIYSVFITLPKNNSTKIPKITLNDLSKDAMEGGYCFRKKIKNQ